MIVVDSNVVAYCWLNGSKTAIAQSVRLQDSDWHVPVLWRSELRSILGGYVRRGDLSVKQATAVMQRIEAELQGQEHIVESDDVLKLLDTSDLSAYDCEFVALARAVGTRLVTEERAILKAFPRESLSMDAFVR
ncbi:MAG: type II toxin-antitoxin system VapC family toxin [Acidobacteria bacterium]|nr:type II toxin-antitoxin system VapC family toxin [Acidobacteriota bacterium]